MTQEDDRFDEVLRKAAQDYNAPPELKRSDLDEMWVAVERAKSTAGVGHRRWDVGKRHWVGVRTLLPLAAVLMLGVAIGRFSAKRPGPASISHVPSPISAVAAIPEPYHSTTSQYLGQTAALLVALPVETRAGQDYDDRFTGRAHDLLLTTRLLMDSPAAADPRFRTLLEDLELVLAQVVRLQTDRSPAELDLIRQALEQRDVLPRLRTVVADLSADD